MGALEEVIALKNQGLSDPEIIRKLQERGASPVEITEAMSRAQIKNAVSYPGTDGMEPSIMGGEDEPERLPLEGLEGGTLSDEDLTPPRPSGFPGYPAMPSRMTKEIYPSDEGSGEVYSPQAQYQYSQAPPQQETYSYSQPAIGGLSDTDTLIEIAEQVFMEKNKSVQRRVEELNEFRTLFQSKVENISERLKRMESIIDRLQASILEKIGSYGQGLESVRKEMTMMQESFGKVVSRVADSSHRHHSQSHHAEKAVVSHTGPHHVTVHKSTKRTVRKHKKK